MDEKPAAPSVVFMTRLKAPDAERIRWLAAQDDRPASALIRKIVVQHLRQMEAS
jgi:hypothetical protein